MLFHATHELARREAIGEQAAATAAELARPTDLVSPMLTA
jgi:hypothetical protein